MDPVCGIHTYPDAEEEELLEEPFTVILQLNFLFRTAAVMVAVPAFFAVTFPVLVTAATLLLDDFQITFWLVPFSLSTVLLPVFMVVLDLLIVGD